MENRLAAQNSVTPQLHLSAPALHVRTKAPVGPGSQRSGPGSPRRRPAAAGRLHRNPPYFFTGVAGGVAGISKAHGPSFVTHKQRAHCPARYFWKVIFFPDFKLQLIRIRLTALFGPP